MLQALRCARAQNRYFVPRILRGFATERFAHDPNSGLIRPNHIKQVLESGGTAFVATGYLALTADSVDALAGPSGFDGVWLEGEHGPLEYGQLGNLSRACDLWGMTAIARVNKSCNQVNENAIYRHLDGGVQGIIVPKIQDKAQAQRVADACKFKTSCYPTGLRGTSPGRQAYGLQHDYYTAANDTVLSCVMIEDMEGVANLDDILTVEGIDVFFVARFDTAQSMGYIDDIGNPEVSKVVTDCVKKIVKAGRHCGAVGMGESATKKHHDLGARFFYTVPKNVAGGVKNFIQTVDPSHPAGSK